MVTEQFSLCWDNFHKNMSQGMQSLLENEDLVDVTLAVEGRYLKAHKMVLSVCSPYFRELFQSNPCKHPIVFMKDVSYIALSDLLQFMYQGEVQVAQENLTTFIKTAESLQIKGLTGDGNQSETDIEIEPDKPPDTFPKKYREQVETPKPALSNSPRPKKPLPGPASKRPKLQTSLISESGTSSVSTKSEASSGGPTTQEIIQFKMEPYEQSNIESVENQEETYGSETLDDTAQGVGDDTEDFSLMETGDDEPHPGTSGDGTGDGQDEKSHEKALFRKRWCKAIEAHGFTYHQNSSKNNGQIRYLVCSEYKRLVCRARAILPAHGKIEDLVVTRIHNHPPNKYSVDVSRSRFVNLLKRLICSSPGMALRDIYISAKELDPEGSEVCPFHKIANSMRRWKNVSLKGGSNQESVAFDKESATKVEFSIETSEKKPKKRMNARMRFVVDGFVYHNNVIAGTPPLRYLGCAEFKRAGCRARASIPVGGTLDQLKVTKPHNHPPDINAEERYEFVKELKSAVRSMQNATLKKVYETIAEIYPSGAEEIPFKSISSSLHRWRCNPHL